MAIVSAKTWQRQRPFRLLSLMNIGIEAELIAAVNL
jgi:hypothetical protein